MTKIHFKEYTKSDSIELARIKNSKEVMDTFCNEPTNPTEIDEEVKKALKRKYKTYYYTIILEEDNQKTIIGCFAYDIIDTKNKRCMINYYLDSNYQGIGYGTTVVGLAVNFGKKFKLNKLVANVINENIASQNVLLKNNFKQCAVYKKHIFYNGKFHDMFAYEYLY